MKSYAETHTAIADDYEEKAKAVDVTTNLPYSSCYKEMPEQTELLGLARVHQEEARKIRKVFREISKENAISPNNEMLTKDVLNIKSI